MMTNVLTLDPGLRAPGLAYFEAGKFVWATCVQADSGERGPRQWNLISRAVRRAMVSAAPGWVQGGTIVVEKPQVYPKGKGPNANPDDLVELAAALGACVAALDDVVWPGVWVTYLPREWKGQVPKDVHHRRILKKLSSEELELLHDCLEDVPESLRHNAIDAVGIGLKYLRRIR